MSSRTIAVALIASVAVPGIAGDGIEWLKPPEGAVVLFDGKDTKAWAGAKTTDDGFLMAGPATSEKFGDCILHLEFNMLPRADGKGNSGNSGVYLQTRYEVQILNSHGRKPEKGGCAAIYQFKPPDQNVTRPIGEWQSYTIAFRQPRWDGDKKTENARITVVHNGVKVQDNVEVPNKTGHGQKEEPAPGPLRLQNHGNPVVFRNVWLLPLGPDDDPAAKLKALLAPQP